MNIERTVVRAGDYALKLYVPYTGALVDYHQELVYLGPKCQIGEACAIGMALCYPTNNYGTHGIEGPNQGDHWEIHFQSQSPIDNPRDAQDTATRNPWLRFGYGGNVWAVAAHYDVSQPTTGANRVHYSITSRQFPQLQPRPGEWFDLVIRYKLSPYGAKDGFLEVYVNRKLVKGLYKIGLGDNNIGAPGWKMGLYKQRWRAEGSQNGILNGRPITERTIYRDSVRYARGAAATLANVTPPGARPNNCP
jgi:hypothetical protein